MFLQPPINKTMLAQLCKNLVNTVKKTGFRPAQELQVIYAKSDYEPVEALADLANVLTQLRITTFR